MTYNIDYAAVSMLSMATLIGITMLLWGWVIAPWRSHRRLMREQARVYIDSVRQGTDGLGRPTMDAMLWARLYPNREMHMSTSNYNYLHAEAQGLKAFVFYIFDERAGVLEDELNMFPSDALITKIRLLQG